MGAPTGEPTPVVQLPATGGLTQDAVNAIVARETDRAKAAGITAATAEFEKTLGMSVADVAKLLQDRQAADDAAKSDAQKALEKATRDSAAAATVTATAKAEVFATRAERSLLRAGLAIPADAKPEVVDALLTRVRGMLTAGIDADAAAIDADVTALKATFPALFAPATTPPPPGTDPRTRPTGAPAPTGGLAAGLARATAAAKATTPGVGAWGRRNT